MTIIRALSLACLCLVAAACSDSSGGTSSSSSSGTVAHSQCPPAADAGVQGDRCAYFCRCYDNVQCDFTERMPHPEFCGTPAQCEEASVRCGRVCAAGQLEGAGLQGSQCGSSSSGGSSSGGVSSSG